MFNYSPTDWFWLVNQDETQVYSTAASGFVPASHPSYLAWREAGGLPTRIASLAELRDVLMQQAPACWKRDVVDMWEAIKAERDRRTQEGGYPAAGKWFHSDTFSRTQQIGLVMLGAGIPVGTMWKTMDGSFIEMTPPIAQQVFAAAAAQDLATFAAAEAHKAAMEAAADPAAYDSSAGWPAVFGG